MNAVGISERSSFSGAFRPSRALEALEGVRALRFGRAVHAGCSAPRDDLPVQQELAGFERQGDGDLGKLHRDVVEGPRKERDPRARLVRVGADAVEFLFDGEIGKVFDDFRGVLDRAREHEADRVEEPERELLQAPVPRGDGRLADVAAVAPRPRDRFPVGVECPRDRLRPSGSAPVLRPPEGLDEVLRLDRRRAPQELLDRLLLQRGFLEVARPRSAGRPRGSQALAL